jgi:hypothetical protein
MQAQRQRFKGRTTKKVLFLVFYTINTWLMRRRAIESQEEASGIPS